MFKTLNRPRGLLPTACQGNDETGEDTGEKNMTRVERFRAKNRGRYAIRQAGILVLRPFETREQACEWATGNYRHPENWDVVQL
jgi:hypothetical protein